MCWTIRLYGKGSTYLCVVHMYWTKKNPVSAWGIVETHENSTCVLCNQQIYRFKTVLRYKTVRQPSRDKPRKAERKPWITAHIAYRVRTGAYSVPMCFIVKDLETVCTVLPIHLPTATTCLYSILCIDFRLDEALLWEVVMIDLL